MLKENTLPSYLVIDPLPVTPKRRN